MSEATTPTPAGWYPDPAGGPRNRWWDGTVWTETFSESHPNAGGVAPAGVRTNTVWIWLVLFVPYLSLPFLFAIDFGSFFDSAMRGAGDGRGAELALITSPGYVLLLIVGWTSSALTVFLSYLDWRSLRNAGVPRPFHWAFGFISLLGYPVYAIGRGVVARRRTGSGIWSMWVAIGLLVLSFIVSIVWASVNISALLQQVPFS